VHLLHHRWVGIIDKDPTQKDLLKLHHSSNVQNMLFRIVWRLWIPIPFAQFLYKVFWGYAFVALKNKEYKNFRLGLFSNLICLIAHGLIIGFLSLSTWATYFLPMLVVFYFMIENMNLPQHSELFPYLSDTRAEPIPFAQQDEITRSTHLPDLLGCILALNFNRHTEHHLFPATPWYNLNKMRKMLIDSGYSVPNEVEFMEFMYKLRSRDPLHIYRDSLPKPVASVVNLNNQV
jgi:fatty acid desaturase